MLLDIIKEGMRVRKVIPVLVFVAEEFGRHDCPNVVTGGSV